MGRPTFRAYVENIEAKTGKTQEDFWKLAGKMGFVKRGKIVATYAELLKWLKSDIGLGHVHSSFVILTMKLRAKDPHVSSGMKEWARKTGYEG
ncbi:MAG: DUF4287 domain-containing protein [Candidatus Micrarchaeota archaeon]|nr:DUF4287 domain-containing protein [Candidatus Micrarchaeota archaeon]MDE1834828.1 DUF4287 domain-containing protein [Candidatus Micrarchaeota archaeon]MDE1859716.1 DUF4287 domain-containing protein [Candidatus Micrarchaeota archaeon]